MDDLPQLMRAAANRIATPIQSTPGVEGYLFDGVDPKPNGILEVSRNGCVGGSGA